MSQICLLNIKLFLTRGHLSIQDTSPGKCVSTNYCPESIYLARYPNEPLINHGLAIAFVYDSKSSLVNSILNLNRSLGYCTMHAITTLWAWPVPACLHLVRKSAKCLHNLSSAVSASNSNTVYTGSNPA